MILEIGVGTGVVALGLRRRGRRVLGLDLSFPMLSRARGRLGPVVACSDAMEMSVATASVAHAVSVWVMPSVAQPVPLFHEAARVIQPRGRYVVCATQDPAPDDYVGQIISEMSVRADVRRATPRPRRVSVDEVLDWAGEAGFTGTIHQLERQWVSSPRDELSAIAHRSWPAMRELDEAAIDEVTGPAIEALRALPQTESLRRAVAEMVVFERP